MRYRVFLYGTSAATGTAPAIGIVNAAISGVSEESWQQDDAAHFMRPFDTEHILRCIEKELTDPVSGTCKCRSVVKYPPKKFDQIAYLSVVTSYEKAAEVLPRLHAIAAEHELVLYDAETQKSFFKDLVDRTYIALQNRRRVLDRAILQDMKPVWTLRRLEFHSEERDKWYSAVVTLRKDPEVSFAQRSARFYACLRKNLHEDEELICENQCYCIRGQWYTITYVLEGYKKHPNQIGYMENGEARASLLRRMSADEAFVWLKTCTETEKNDIFARMRFLEMRDKYPNPAQRFVESVRITKWQRKQVFDIRYSDIGYYGAEILFHVVPDSFYENAEEISVLKIEEGSASFLLPFVEDLYPDFDKRYYMNENHISSQMMERILARLREAKKLVLHDTFGTELEPYIQQFNLFVLEHHPLPDYWEEVNKTDNVQILYRNRYRVAELYDVFIRWAQAQLDTHCYVSDLMFNIQGP